MVCVAWDRSTSQRWKIQDRLRAVHRSFTFGVEKRCTTLAVGPDRLTARRVNSFDTVAYSADPVQLGPHGVYYEVRYHTRLVNKVAS